MQGSGSIHDIEPIIGLDTLIPFHRVDNWQSALDLLFRRNLGKEKYGGVVATVAPCFGRR